METRGKTDSRSEWSKRNVCVLIQTRIRARVKVRKGLGFGFGLVSVKREDCFGTQLTWAQVDGKPLLLPFLT